MTLPVQVNIHLKMDILPFELQSLICSFSKPQGSSGRLYRFRVFTTSDFSFMAVFRPFGLLVATKFDNVALA